MVFKLVILVAILASTVYSGNIPIAYSAESAYISPYTRGPALLPSAPKAVVSTAEDYDPNPQYAYGYDVQDGLTGDSKSQSEHRNGDVVQGSYSVVDPDGTKRTVEYTADPVNGFNAVVHREPLAVKAAPVAYAPSPVAAAPVAYAKYVH